MKSINENSKIRGVVFDLDHTLFDRYATLDEISYEFYEDFRGRLSGGITREEASRLIIEADSLYVVSGWRNIHSCLCKKGLFRKNDEGVFSVSYEEYSGYMLNKKFLEHAVAYPFTVPMLKELKTAGLKVALITNSWGELIRERQYSKMNILGISDLFDEIVISGEYGIHKPDKGIFDIMTEKLGLPAGNMLYVGDNPINDIEGSKNAGYIPVWVRLRECVGERAECEYSVSDVSEIPALVEKLNSLE